MTIKPVEEEFIADLARVFAEASGSTQIAREAKIERLRELWQELTGETELPLSNRTKHSLLFVGRMCTCPQCGSIVETERIKK
jgi:hypothetical protein